jgi:LmbE family N-acetylglucosaminyl deacetylase/SAM-dependent methyltransferase
MTTGFDHRHRGTPEASWMGEKRLTGAPALQRPARGAHLVVLAAHPDDETLGAGGLIAAAAAQEGVSIEVIVATDGEASHPDSPTHTSNQLAVRRRAEATEAIACLDPHATVSFLGLPDGGLRNCQTRLVEVLTERLRPGCLVVTPWRGDRHPDHAACAVGTRALLRRRDDCVHWQYPIWAWHWADPAADQLPWSTLHRLDLPVGPRWVKQVALACYRSQHEPLSDRAGDDVVLPEHVLAHFRRTFESFVLEAAHAAGATGYFDALYCTTDDPWGLADRSYETRKRDLLMACLPRDRFRRAFEPGCATGLLTERLATRAEQVLACDAAGRAVQVARERLAGTPNVAVAQCTILGEWPEGCFDLIVLSEIGYYCDDLDALTGRVLASLAADGVVVACHWRHPAPQHPRTAVEIHAALERVLIRLVQHVEADFLLDVWSRTGESVARAEGILG